jgi:hypothetical protein
LDERDSETIDPTKSDQSNLRNKALTQIDGTKNPGQIQDAIMDE